MPTEYVDYNERDEELAAIFNAHFEDTCPSCGISLPYVLRRVDGKFDVRCSYCDEIIAEGI